MRPHLGWIYPEDDGLVVKCIARQDGSSDHNADVFHFVATAEEAVEFADKQYGHLFPDGKVRLNNEVGFLGYKIINPLYKSKEERCSSSSE